MAALGRTCSLIVDGSTRHRHNIIIKLSTIHYSTRTTTNRTNNDSSRQAITFNQIRIPCASLDDTISTNGIRYGSRPYSSHHRQYHTSGGGSQSISSSAGVVIDSVSGAETKLMRNIADKLLQVPVGKIDPSLWYDAEDCVKWWVSQRTEMSVIVSLNLLDRFVREAQANETASDNLLLFFDRTVLTTMVHNWYQVWKDHEIEWTPPRLLDALVRYETHTPQLVQMSWKNLSYIINAWQYRSDPAQAVGIMDELLSTYLEQNTRGGPVAVTLVNLVLKFWSNSGRRDAIIRAEQIFAKAKSSLGPCQLDIISYNTMLDVYSTGGCAEQAEAFLEAMVRDHLDDPDSVAPDAISFGSAISAWSRSSHPEAPERAIYLLRRIVDPFNILGEIEISPETTFYNHILTCWSRSGRPDAGDQSYQLLNEMKGVEGVEPDQYSYGIVADAFAKCGKPDRTELVLDELLEQFRENPCDELRPNCFIFSSIMNAWEQSNSPDREQRVRNAFHRMLDLGKEGIMLDLPGTWMFNHVIGAIVSSGTMDRAERADEFLNWMKEQFRNGADNVRPNEWSYTSVICAYLEEPNGLSRATQLLSEGFDNKTFRFNIRTVARVILGLAKADQSEAAAEWLHRVLQATEEGYFGDKHPTPSLLGGVLASLYRASQRDKKALYEADGLVRRFCELEERGILKQGMDRNIGRLLILMWVQSNDKNTLGRIDDILQYMRRKADNGQTNIIPDLDVFRLVVRQFALSNTAHADTLFRELMKDYIKDKRRAKPTLEMLNTVLRSWSNVENSTSAFGRAEALLMEFRRHSLAGKRFMPPEQRSFHYVMSVGGNIKNSASSMKRLFELMKQDSRKGNRNVQPGLTTYEFLIHSLCQEGRHEEAEKYLREACAMYQNKRLGDPPTCESFARVIEAWRYSKQSLTAGAPASNVLEGASEDARVEQSICNLLELQQEVLGNSEKIDL